MAKAKKKKNTDPVRVINKRYDPECPISSIQEHDLNAREGDVGALHESIEHNGFYGALVVQESTGKILAGNHRYRAAVQKGAPTIPVIWVDCSDNEAKRILISDNRHSDLAAYNNAALAELLEQIKIDTTNLGWHGTGWDDESFQNLLSDLNGSMFEEQSAGKDSIPEKFEVLVTCSHEAQQAEVLELLHSQGYECRALIG